MSFESIFLWLLLLMVATAIPTGEHVVDHRDEESKFTNMMKKLMTSLTFPASENRHAAVADGDVDVGIARGTANVEGADLIKSLDNQNQLTSTEESHADCPLSSSQVLDIQSPNPNLFYMVVNKEAIADTSLFELYVQLLGIVSKNAATNNHITDIWLSHSPCKPCMEFLNFTFSGAASKPTIHIDSWKMNGQQEVTYSTILQSMGCLSKLKSYGYRVQTWDWSMLQEDTSSNSCRYYTDGLQSNVKYASEKENLKASLPLIARFNEFC